MLRKLMLRQKKVKKKEKKENDGSLKKRII